jgi:hypothetical protein
MICFNSSVLTDLECHEARARPNEIACRESSAQSELFPNSEFRFPHSAFQLLPHSAVRNPQSAIRIQVVPQSFKRFAIRHSPATP